MANDVEFNIIARDKASSTFSKVGRSSRDAESGISKLGTSAKHALGAVLAFETAKTVTKGLIGMAKAAAEDQTSVALLAKQYKNSAHATNLQIASTEAWITKVGIARGVADDELRPALGNLVTATHSVRKAQELANLAMNIAAAKGKPLSAVSLALSKAYNGNVGALGRLGIKTKDNAGKTLTFVAAQKMLNQQFGGAANAKAKTFTGVMDRFHVAVQEGGEAIGYKLLPELTKFVPKATKFINGMQDGTGAGGRFADTIKDDVLPVAKNLASEVGAVAGAFKPLIKITSQLPPQLVATGGAIGILGTKIGGLRAPLGEGATGFAKFGRAASSAAGAGGLLAVADAANRTNPALAGLEGAVGGAATGFAIGGPLGAGLGFVGGGLLGIFNSGHKAADGMDAAARAARIADRFVGDYADTLKGLSAISTADTRRAVIKNVEDNRKLFKSLGLNDKVIINAILGRADSVDRTLAAIEGPLKAQRAAIAKQQQVAVDAYKKLGSYPGSAADLEAAKKKLDAMKDQYTVAKALAKAQRDTLADLEREQKAERKRRAEALSFNDLLKRGVPKPIATLIDKNGISQNIGDVAKLIDKFHVVDQTKWKAILSAEGLVPTQKALREIDRLLRDAARARTAKLALKITGDVGMASALGAFGSNVRTAGGGIMDQLVAQITKGTPKVKIALQRAQGQLQGFKNQLESLQATKAGFQSTFSPDSIFGADADASGGSLAGLLQFQQQQATNAQQLFADIKAVTSRGASKQLLAQLQAAGSAGSSQLHLLASANQGQIAQFNALAGSAASADSAAGLLLGNSINGGKPGVGNIDADIRSAKQAKDLETAIIRALGTMKLETRVKGGDLIVAVRTTNHNRGRQPGDFSK